MEINKDDGSMNAGDYIRFFVFATFSAIAIYVFYKAMF
jgi:hypothetical protein